MSLKLDLLSFHLTVKKKSATYTYKFIQLFCSRVNSRKRVSYILCHCSFNLVPLGWILSIAWHILKYWRVVMIETEATVTQFLNNLFKIIFFQFKWRQRTIEDTEIVTFFGRSLTKEPKSPCYSLDSEQIVPICLYDMYSHDIWFSWGTKVEAKQLRN